MSKNYFKAEASIRFENWDGMMVGPGLKREGVVVGHKSSTVGGT